MIHSPTRSFHVQPWSPVSMARDSWFLGKIQVLEDRPHTNGKRNKDYSKVPWSSLQSSD